MCGHRCRARRAGAVSAARADDEPTAVPPTGRRGTLRRTETGDHTARRQSGGNRASARGRLLCYLADQLASFSRRPPPLRCIVARQCEEFWREPAAGWRAGLRTGIEASHLAAPIAAARHGGGAAALVGTAVGEGCTPQGTGRSAPAVAPEAAAAAGVAGTWTRYRSRCWRLPQEAGTLPPRPPPPGQDLSVTVLGHPARTGGCGV